MSRRFFSRLSQNYIEILRDEEYYDITIEVGKDPNIILKYIYGGIISLNGQEPSEILKILTAADELLLHELVDYLQDYLIENKFEWIEQHFELTYRTSFQSNSLLELQNYCTDFMDKFPEKVFKSLDFASLPEASLISLIIKDDLQMKEIEIWEHVLKWGLEKNPTLLPDPITCLSSEDFFQKVYPYKKLLEQQLYEELLGSYLDSNVEPKTGEIIGGYNPLVWKSYSTGRCGKTKDSFIFSFKNKDNFRDLILSHVKNMDKAIYYKNSFGPTFYDDLDLYVMKGGIEPREDREYNYSSCKQKSYEKKIRNEEGRFTIEDYEVFQIVNNHAFGLNDE
ncbi:BTB/POZ protein [Rhizophagus irregularis DAOM 181602=DAOM 197198]|nr:BTB/POZ protein [Rhizophagus irregularis DAOM 181602=DAOM 197198]